VEAAYGGPVGDVTYLPNPIHLPGTSARNPSRPRVVYLGRLDPIKRPWLFVELAARIPDVEFLLLGDAYLQGEGAWTPADLPFNVTAPGHVGEEAKARALWSSSVLVNTSIHEGLAVSFLEGLAAGNALLSTTDPGGVVTRFGEFVGRHDGDGRAAVPLLEDGLRTLLDDEEGRRRRAEAGQEWVATEHTASAFLAAFAELASRTGNDLPGAAT
jgi:glycosyltransferase involved in cell wall biosynthesis